MQNPLSEENLGIYIHIPFCLQRCLYCDFATYSQDQIRANQKYVDTLLIEATLRRHLWHQTKLQTIYFGGGTPSLLEAEQIAQILSHLKSLDLEWLDTIEITLEVNPATLTADKCQSMKQAGVNRISLGCQSFNDLFLKNCNREHNAQDSLNTIELIQKYYDNYSLDLLFALPHQSTPELLADLKVIKELNPPHVSAYCLTVPDKHPMAKNRPADEEQTQMFHWVKSELSEIGLHQYEISNFARPGYESRHNNLYWTDQSYWGLGLSAHSYQKEPDWGKRFWNASNYDTYMEQVSHLALSQGAFPKSQQEELKLYESLSDYCHTHLRLLRGLNTRHLSEKFGSSATTAVLDRLSSLSQTGWLKKHNDSWSLTELGVLVSNRIFAELLFTSEDIDKLT